MHADIYTQVQYIDDHLMLESTYRYADRANEPLTICLAIALIGKRDGILVEPIQFLMVKKAYTCTKTIGRRVMYEMMCVV